MKNFIINLLKFFVTVVSVQLIILFFSFLLNNSPYYFDNYSNEFVSFKDVDLAFFGDSHSEYGFNDKIVSQLFKNNTRNISLSGNTLYNNILVLEKVLLFNPNIIVNLSIGNHNVGESYFLTGNNVSQEIKQWFSYYNFKELKYLFEKYPREFLKGFFGIISTVDIKTYGFSEGVSRMDVLMDRNIEATGDNQNYFNSNPMWLNKLTDVIKQNPNTKFRVIRIPIHESVFAEEQFYLSVIEQIIKFDNVDFQDYQNLKLKNNDFRDFTHLSKSGAEKLSKEYFRRN